MKILVDADACPVPIKEILYKVSERRAMTVVFVANQNLRLPSSRLITLELVSHGADEADDRIVDIVAPDDLVITADIPLATRVIKKGAYVLEPHGNFLTEGNIGPRIALRNLMDTLRSEGMHTGGPGAFSPKDKKAFADQLDTFLAGKKRP